MKCSCCGIHEGVRSGDWLIDKVDITFCYKCANFCGCRNNICKPLLENNIIGHHSKCGVFIRHMETYSPENLRRMARLADENLLAVQDLRL